VIIGELVTAEQDELKVLSEEGTTYKVKWENVQKARLTL
jgi:ribosome maturation factor RimP